MFIQLVSATQRAGDFRSMYPKGCERVTDIPWFLQVAIDQALMILNWRENLTTEEVPPEHIWEDADGLDEWWQRVQAKRSDGMPMASRRESPDGEDEQMGWDGPKGSQGQEMVQNDLARALRS